MKRFVSKICIFTVLLMLLVLGQAIVRIVSYKNEVETTMRLHPWQKVLFIGDSHIGCTFVEERKYENYILWESSMPQQFTLMRLRDMEKCDVLQNVDLIVLDIGLQSIGQQRTGRMKEFWWRMIPIAMHHSDVLPLTIWDKIEQFVTNPMGRIHIKEDMPTADVSVMTRTIEERQSELQLNAETHFNWIKKPNEMCYDWERSLSCAVDEICEVCKRNQIQLVFITAPLTSYYVESIPKDVNAKLETFTEQIRRNGVPYYDLREWGDDDDFRDCFHFRLQGAKKFTEWFYKEIVPKHRKMK